MANLPEISTQFNQTSSIYCGKCKKEYQFIKFISQYPKQHHDRILQLWENNDIRFYCSYCYLLEIIKEIKKKI